MKRNEDFKADLLDELRNDPEYAAEYLSAAKADSREAFLVALRDVAEAQKGMKRVAKEANVNRENLYRAFSKKGNPRVDTLDSVLDVLGIETRFVPKRVSATAASGSSNARRRTAKKEATGIATTTTGETFSAVVASTNNFYATSSTPRYQAEYQDEIDWKDVTPAMLIQEKSKELNTFEVE